MSDAPESTTPAAGIATSRFRRDGWRGELVTGSPLHQWLLDGGRPESIGSPSDMLVRDGSRSQCFRITQLDEQTPLVAPMFFKIYRVRPGVQAWFKRRIGWHRTSWAWRLGWIIHSLGVNVAQPWGYLVPAPWRIGKCSYFWTEWIDDARHARSLASEPSSRALLTDSLWFPLGVAEMLARLHGGGVYHRDMNWGNLLVNTNSQRISLIDLDSAHRLSLKPHASACRDLARFLMEATDYHVSDDWKNEFLDRYASIRKLQLRQLERQIEFTMRMFYRRRRKKRLPPQPAPTARSV